MALKDRTLATVTEVLGNSLHRGDGEITANTLVHDELNATSLNFVEIQAVAQEKYGALLSFAELQRCKTVGEIADVITKAILG